jgi:hypothetical protein
MGITGLVLRWIEAYLTDRIQRVRVNNCTSSSKPVISGVAQGSVLGPLLFLIFINDVSSIVGSQTVIKLFADDIKLYFAIENTSSPNTVQSSLDAVAKWSAAWQLNLSPNKCVVLSIGSNINPFNYYLNDVSLKRVSSVKDLGVWIDPLLTFDEHINKVCNAARQRSALIFKTFQSRNPILLFRAFNTFVRPSLEYASVIWNPCKCSSVDKIEAVQRNFTKKLTGLYYLSYSDRISKLSTETLELRRLKFDLIMYYKIIHGLIDIDNSKFFNRSAYTTTRGNSYKLSKPIISSNFDANQFCNRNIDVWNSLPDNIVNAISVSNFKRLIDHFNFLPFLRF